MRIYTKFVIDIASGKTLSSQGFEYTGPIAEAGKKKSKSKTTVKTIRSPEEQELTELRLAQEKAQEPQKALARAGVGRLLDPSFRLPTGFDPTRLNLPGLSDLRFSAPELAFGASRLASQTSTADLEAATKRTLEEIIGPQILSALTAGGQGRSGAVAEALAKEGTRLGVPIVSEARNAERRLTDFLANISQQRQSVAAGLSQPSTQFFPAPTTITTQKQTSSGFNPLDLILPVASVAAAPFTGGASLAAGGFLSGLNPFNVFSPISMGGTPSF